MTMLRPVSLAEATLIAAALGPALGKHGKAIQPEYRCNKQKRRIVANRIAKASRKRNRGRK